VQLGGYADFEHPLILSHVPGLMRFSDGSDKGVATMKTSCPGLSLLMIAGLTVMTLWQSDNPPNGKVQTH
jgi:hypothetical protein